MRVLQFNEPQGEDEDVVIWAAVANEEGAILADRIQQFFGTAFVSRPREPPEEWKRNCRIVESHKREFLRINIKKLFISKFDYILSKNTYGWLMWGLGWGQGVTR